jgi:hypothetical protein
VGSGQQTVGSGWANGQWVVDRKTVNSKQWAVNSGHGQRSAMLLQNVTALYVIALVILSE